MLTHGIPSRPVQNVIKKTTSTIVDKCKRSFITYHTITSASLLPGNPIVKFSIPLQA